MKKLFAALISCAVLSGGSALAAPAPAAVAPIAVSFAAVTQSTAVTPAAAVGYYEARWHHRRGHGWHRWHHRHHRHMVCRWHHHHRHCYWVRRW